jgi:geranylgeranyl pyrophosphate synthase
VGDILFQSFPEEIARVEEIIASSVQAQNGLLREAADYVGLGGGKKLRPRLVILAARAVGRGRTDDDHLLPVAAAVEVLHTASLLHDDVVDHASERRTRPSVNSRYGDELAVLLADYFFTYAFDLALSVLDPRLTRLLCAATREMCEGEIFQIEKRNALLTQDDYYRIIGSKTSSLFALCTELGALVADAPDDTRRALARFGRLSGMAYQVTDDVLDYTVTDGKWGKPRGHDLAEGKQTLPLVRTCECASEIDRTALLGHLSNGRRMEDVLPVIEKYGGLDYARAKARDFAREAEATVPAIAPDPRFEHLFHEFSRFTIERPY